MRLPQRTLLQQASSLTNHEGAGMKTKLGELTYNAKSLEDIAAAFDGLAADFKRKSLFPKETVAAKRFNAGVCYGYEQAAQILRRTTMEKQ